MVLLNLFITTIMLAPSLAVNINFYKVSDAYINLIMDLKQFYNASSVFIIYDNFNENILATTILFQNVRQLSAKRLFSQVLRHSELSERYNSTFSKYPRQLFILPLENENDLTGFADFTRYHELSFHIWFVVFWSRENRYLIDFCRKPDKNRFHLKFDTRMLVKCYDDPNLREWYTVNSQAEVLINDLMTWKPETGLRLKTEKNLYQRRTNAAGTVLKVSTIKEHPNFLTTNPDGEDFALFAKMMLELAKHMNFHIEFVSSNDIYGFWNQKENKWSGILGKLQSNEIDVAIAEITMTKERLDAFDFACPLLLSQAKLFIKEPGYADFRWNAYLKAFNYNIWLSLIILIILSAILLTYMKTKINKVSSLKSYLVESHLYVWGIYCQQGLSEFPDSSSLRIAYVSIFFSAIVLSAIYSASIISYLTIFSPTLPFNTLPKYVRDGSYKLTVIRDSAEHEMFMTSEDYILQKMNKLMVKEEDLPINDVEAFEQVCRARVAYYSNDAMKSKMGDTIPCKLIGIATGRVDNLAFALTKNNPYTEFINYNILRFQDSGIMQRMKKMYFKKPIKPMKVYDAVGLWGIAPLILILIFGTVLSIFLLLLEYIHYYKRRYNTNYFNGIMPFHNSQEITTWRYKREYSKQMHS